MSHERNVYEDHGRVVAWLDDRETTFTPQEAHTFAAELVVAADRAEHGRGADRRVGGRLGLDGQPKPRPPRFDETLVEYLNRNRKADP